MVEIARPSAAAKYFSASPPDSQKASSITIVDEMPLRRFYELAKNGEFPVKVLRIGRRYVVPIPALMALLEA